MSAFPKVLIISKVRVTERDNSGASIGKWFADWPRESIAQLFTGGVADGGGFFDNEFRIGARERRFGSVFYRMKTPVLDSVLQKPIPTTVSHGKRPKAIVRRSLATLFRSGLWELLFAPRLSDDLRTWIRRFKPDVLYVQPADLGLITLTHKIADEAGVPIAVQMSDDFPTRIYNNILMRGHVDRMYRSIFNRATVCLGTGPSMREAYQRRYHKEFVPLMICDEPSRFDSAPHAPFGRSAARTILYSGALSHYRWQGLLDMIEAIRTVQTQDVRCELHVFTPRVPDEAAELLTAREVIIHGPPTDREVPSLFKAADVLFLPESFRRDVAASIELSISTKAHLYMMAKRPVIVYGPLQAGVVDYAARENWSYTVTERNLSALATTLRQALLDRENQVFGTIAHTVVERNHNARNVRERFRALLSQTTTTCTR